jgi:integrase
MTTGLRVGEILSLKLENIGEKYIAVNHSFSKYDGLKGTKTGESRVVPIISGLRDVLRKLGAQNPHGDGFIFYGGTPNKPIANSIPLFALKNELVKMKIGVERLETCKITEGDTDEEKMQKSAEEKRLREEAVLYWKERNIVFHSWRHFYAARMTDKLEARKVMLATGHKTEAVFKKYSDHGVENDLVDVANTIDEIFGIIIPKNLLAEKEEGENIAMPV